MGDGHGQRRGRAGGSGAIVAGLRLAMTSGRLGPLDRLPSERELAARFGATRITVREALARLEADGRVFSRRGAGWYVAPPRLVYDPSRRAVFTELAGRQGRAAATTVLEVGRTRPSSEAAPALGLDRRRRVVVVRRVRSLDGRKVVAEEVVLPARFVPGIERADLSCSLTGLLAERYGIGIAEERVGIEARAADGWQAEVLEVAPGTASLRIERIRYGQEGAAVEYDVEVWLHDALRIVVTTRGQGRSPRRSRASTWSTTVRRSRGSSTT